MTKKENYPDICVCCGAPVPEGWMVCSNCENIRYAKTDNGCSFLAGKRHNEDGRWKTVTIPENKNNGPERPDEKSRRTCHEKGAKRN